MKKSGFTLVEIMIVVAIIGLLAAIAIPAFMKNREEAQSNACVNNLRMIDAAKEQAAMLLGWTNNYVIDQTDYDTGTDYSNVMSYVRGGTNVTCPAGGSYIEEDAGWIVGSLPLCTLRETNDPNTRLWRHAIAVEL